jgi:hypothetical protein
VPGSSPLRLGLLITTVVLVPLLAGCDDWPLYANLPDPYGEPLPVEQIEMGEDTSLGSEDVQALGTIAAPAHIVLTGDSESCGFDPDDDRFDWPEHPVDEDGDGVPDGTRAVSGWFSGDVDLFGFQAEGDLWLSASLEWANAPPGDANAPYQPTDAEGDWVTESDLDFVVLTLAGDVLTGIQSDAGFSADYPQETAGLLAVPAGGSLALAVACHHEVGSTYTLVVDLVRP